MEKEKKKPGRPPASASARGRAGGESAPAPRRETKAKTARKESSRSAAEGKRNSAASAARPSAEKKSAEAKRRSPRATRTEAAPRHRLKVAFLGGLLEIGKNMCLLEYGRDIIVVDAGIAFPDEELCREGVPTTHELAGTEGGGF